MNPSKFLSVLAAATVFAVGSASAAVLWQSDFSDSDAFTPDQTVYQQGDWNHYSIQSGNLDDAIIENYQGKNMLRLTSSATTAGGYTIVRASFTRTTDPVVKLSFGLGWTATFSPGSTGMAVYGGLNDGTYNYPFRVGMNGNDGIYAMSKDGFVALLSKDQVRTDYLYQFDLTVNYEAQTFDVRLVGLNANGDAVDVTRTGLDFRTPAATPSADFSGLGNLYVANYNGRSASAYIDGFTVTQIPESGTTASLAIGGLTLAGLAYRRQRKSLAARP